MDGVGGEGERGRIARGPIHQGDDVGRKKKKSGVVLVAQPQNAYEKEEEEAGTERSLW